MTGSLKKTRLSFWIGILFLLSPVPHVFAQESDEAAAVERIIWNKTPISVTLGVGKERLITFPGDVRVGVPLDIQSVLRTQSVNGTVYWLADQAFPTQRIQIQAIDRGEMILIDLKAVDQPVSNTPIKILVKKDRNRKKNGKSSGQNEEERPILAQDYVTLTRHAAQQLYAPLRLVHALPGVYRITVNRTPVPLVRGANIKARPLIAWHSGALYISAVQLRNLDNQPIILDPRHLRGQWLAATFQHALLHRTGSEADTTAVYLISARPFEDSM